MTEVSETAHPIFRASNAFERGHSHFCTSAQYPRNSSRYVHDMILWRRWKLLPNLLQPTHGPMNSDGKTCCKNTSNDSNHCLTVERGQYFITLDAEVPSGIVHFCRECTMPRSDPRSRARGWIRKNTKIGPVLNIHVSHHEGRCSIEIQLRSLFQDRTD